jgi:hypothetical protein
LATSASEGRRDVFEADGVFDNFEVMAARVNKRERAL